MKKLLKCLLIGIKCAWYLIGCYFAWILAYSNHPEKYPLEMRYRKVRKLVIFILKHARVDLRLSNLIELNTEESLFLVSNHMSALDPLFLVALSEKPIRFVSKIENRKLPFAGRILMAMDSFFLDRDDPRQAILIFREAYETIQNKTAHICIYPEGTRNRHPYEQDLGEFHPGSFKIPVKRKLDIYPVAIFGTQAIFGNDDFDHKHLIQVSFLDKLNAEEVALMKTTDLADQLHNTMNKAFLDLRAKNIEYRSKKEYKGKLHPWWKELPPL